MRIIKMTCKSFSAHSILTFVFFTALLFQANGFLAPAQQKSKHADKTATLLEIPFENDFGLIFIPVRVNDSAPLWFLLDTGFEADILNAKWREPLGLKLTDVQIVPQPGGAIEMGKASNLTYRIGGLTIENQNLQTAPLSQLEPVIGRPLDGILGHDFISRYTIEIDYDRKLLKIHDPDKFEYKGAGAIVPLTVTNKEPFFDAVIAQAGNSPVTAKFKLDTGSFGSIGFNKNFLDEKKLLVPNQSSLEEPGIAVGGETKGVSFRLSELKIADFTLRNLVVSATLDSGGFENRRDAGTLGGEILERFKLILDYPRNRLIFEKGRRFSRDFVYDLSGLQLVAEGADFKIVRIHRVLENSPAAQAGLIKGDRLLFVNNKKVETLSLSSIRALLRDEKHKKLKLVIRRDNAEREISLVLRRRI